MLEQIKQKLEALPYGRESITVFGRARINVHVVAKSRETAQKWGEALAQAFKARVSITETLIERQAHVSGKPDHMKAYRIACIA